MERDGNVRQSRTVGLARTNSRPLHELVTSWSSVRTMSEKFENAALFLRLGLPSTLIRHENGACYETAFQTGGIWKRRFFVFVWTDNIFKLSLIPEPLCIMPKIGVHLQVNALIARELSGFTCTSSLTMNEKFQCCTRICECGIENFEFTVSERVQVNPDNSRALSLTFLLFKLNTLHKEISAVLNLHHGYYITIMTSRRLFRHNPVSRGTNQPIRKSEFVQCIQVE